MKLYNQQVIGFTTVEKLNSNKTSFRAISSPVLKQVKNTTTTPAAKDAFVKLASVMGLTALIAWVKSLSKNENEAVVNKLDIIDSNWTQKGNELFLDPEKQGQYMDLISGADSAESIIWTKGLLSKDSAKTESKDITQAEMDMFLEPESNETYLSVFANKTLSSITNKIRALSNSSEDVR